MELESAAKENEDERDGKGATGKDREGGRNSGAMLPVGKERLKSAFSFEEEAAARLDNGENEGGRGRGGEEEEEFMK